MPIQITMPALSPTMTVGKISLWKKSEGDTVEPGEVIAEIETDKATMEVESVDSGIIGKIIVPEGSENVPVNSLIAVIIEDGEDVSALKDFDTLNEPVESADKSDQQVLLDNIEPKVVRDVLPGEFTTNGDVLASPLARKIADSEDIDLKSIQGSGPGGRIIKRDLIQLGKNTIKTKTSDVELNSYSKQTSLSNMRKTIADRLTQSWQNIPHVFLTIECLIDHLLEIRDRLNKQSDDDSHLSINDFIIRASAFALSRVPELNVQWSDDGIINNTGTDIAFALALDSGLITPIIRNAGDKGLAEISSEVKNLVARGREGKLSPDEYQGGNFTISNLGMFGITQFNAIINPPQPAILAIGAAKDTPVVRNGAIAISTIMSCTLSCDHRVIDGSVGAKWLSAFKGFVEEPMTMIL